VIIAFTDNALNSLGQPTCGQVLGNYPPGQAGVPWVGESPTSFNGVGPGALDLRGAATGYIALVALDFSCAFNNGAGASHEFGHLLGAGHYSDPTPGEEWLFSNSRADSSQPEPFDWFGQTYYLVDRSAVADAGACSQATNTFFCYRVDRYSDAIFQGTSGRRNAQALAQTAQSVANYFQGPPVPPGASAQCADGMDNDGDALVDTADPDCINAADNDESGPPPVTGPAGCLPHQYVPVNVNATLTQICASTLGSGYTVRWDHACPGGFFQVWANTPGIGTYLVIPTGATSVPLISTGPPNTSTVTIRACSLGSGLCSPDSSPPVPLTDIC